MSLSKGFDGSLKPSDAEHNGTSTHVSSEENATSVSVNKEHRKEKKESSWKVHVLSIFVLIISSSATQMTLPTMSQYVYFRTGLTYFNSTNHSKSQSVPCEVNNTSEEKELQSKAQADSSYVLLILALAEGVPAVITNLFIGSYSDVVGRKVLFLFSIGGILLKTIILVLVVGLEWELYILYIGYALEGFFGGRSTLIQAVFIVNADITSSGARRTVMVSVVEGALSLAVSLTALSTGHMILQLGYFYPLVIVLAMFITAFVLSVVFIPNTAPMHRKKRELSPLHHARNVFSFYFEGKGRRSLQYRLTILIFFMTLLNILGRMQVTTLYQLNRPFCWDSVKVGYFVAALRGCTAIVSTVFMATAQRCLSLEVIAILGVVSTIAALVLEGLAVNDVMLYLVTVVSVLTLLPIGICRALMSKWTPPEKQGAMFAGVAMVEALCYSVANVVYNTVYAATLSVFRGLVFLIMAALCLVPVCLLLWLRRIAAAEKSDDITISKADTFTVAEVKTDGMEASKCQGNITNGTIEKQY